MILTISPNGSISGLQHKRGKGPDLRTLGIARIIRATLIEFDPALQEWIIRWTPEAAQANGFGQGPWTDPSGEIMSFVDYDEAVTAEVARIESLQTAGRFVFP